LPDIFQGVVVVEVDPAGPSRQAHITPGELILEINRRPTTTAAQFQAAVSRIGAGQAAAVLVYDPITEQRFLATVVLDRTP
jgi:serine protease Do